MYINVICISPNPYAHLCYLHVTCSNCYFLYKIIYVPNFFCFYSIITFDKEWGCVYGFTIQA